MTENQASYETSLNGESGIGFTNDTRFPFIDLNTEPENYLSCLEHYGNPNYFDTASHVFSSSALLPSFSLCPDASILEPLALDIFDIPPGANHTSVSAEIPTSFNSSVNSTPSLGSNFINSASSSSSLLTSDTFSNTMNTFEPPSASFPGHHNSVGSNMVLSYPDTNKLVSSSLSNMHIFPQILSNENSVSHSNSSNSIGFSDQMIRGNCNPTMATSFMTSPQTSASPYLDSPIHSSSCPTSIAVNSSSTSDNYSKYYQEVKNHSPLIMNSGIPTPSHLDAPYNFDASIHPQWKSRNSTFFTNCSDPDSWNFQNGLGISEERDEPCPQASLYTSKYFTSQHNSEPFSDTDHISPSADSLRSSSAEQKSYSGLEPISPSGSMDPIHPSKSKKHSKLPKYLESISTSSSRSPSASSLSAPSTPSTPSTQKPEQQTSNSLFSQDYNWLAKSFVNHITDLVLVLAPNGIIAWVSPTSIQSVGFDPEEMYGHPLGEFLHPNYHPCAPKQLTHAVYTNNYFESNIRFRRKDGTYTVLHVIGRVFCPSPYNSTNESFSTPSAPTGPSKTYPLVSSILPSSSLPSSPNLKASSSTDSPCYVLITCRQYPASKFSSMLDEMIDLQFENKYLRNKLTSTYSIVDQEIPVLSALHQSHLYTGDRTCIPTEAIHVSPSSFASTESSTINPYSIASDSSINSNALSQTESNASRQRKSGSAGSLRKNCKLSLSPQLSIRSKSNSEQEKQSLAAKKRKKAANKRDWLQERICYDCGVTQSPEWRRGPTGANTLCNACGLRFAKRQRLGVVEPPGLDSHTPSIKTS